MRRGAYSSKDSDADDLLPSSSALGPQKPPPRLSSVHAGS